LKGERLGNEGAFSCPTQSRETVRNGAAVSNSLGSLSLVSRALLTKKCRQSVRAQTNRADHGPNPAKIPPNYDLLQAPPTYTKETRRRINSAELSEVTNCLPLLFQKHCHCMLDLLHLHLLQHQLHLRLEHNNDVMARGSGTTFRPSRISWTPLSAVSKARECARPRCRGRPAQSAWLSLTSSSDSSSSTSFLHWTCLRFFLPPFLPLGFLP
jgi:hypothetical protein